MFEISDYNELMIEIASIKNLNKKIYTNFYLDEVIVTNLISRKELYGTRIDGVLFLFYDNDKFRRLYYFTSSEFNLSRAIKKSGFGGTEKLVVCDIIGRQKDLVDLDNIFKSNGFNKYVTLNRMSRNSNKYKLNNSNIKLRIANVDDTVKIYDLFNTHFDIIAEQLPNIEEISNWIKKKHIIIAGTFNEMQGFLIYDKIGVTSYLRYWFVDPAFRNKQVGSTLINKYFEHSIDSKRQIFWVIQSNKNAIKRYEHYGFTNENLIDNVYTNKEISYEAKNN